MVPGKTYLLRLSNVGSFNYFTVCVEGHNLTVIATDASPTDPVNYTCVDVEGGQR